MQRMQPQLKKQLREDWGNREYIEVVSANVKKIADFLNSFGDEERDSELMAARASQIAARQVRPVISTDAAEAKKLVLATYRHWMKKSGRIWYEQGLQSTRLSAFKAAIKGEFVKNANVKDLRIIDRLVHKSEVEIANCDIYATNNEHLQNSLLKNHVRPKPADFLSKFFAGKA